MTVSPSTEFWIGMLFVVVFLLLVFLFFIVRKINRLEEFDGFGYEKEADRTGNEAADRILETLTPLLEESQKTAVLFEEQITEKKRLIKELNEALDSRIISLNLQLSRADAQLKKTQEQQLSLDRPPAISFEQQGGISNPFEGDQVEQILGLYGRNMDVDAISRQLSVPKGEVALVIELKKKFIAMEKSGP